MGQRNKGIHSKDNLNENYFSKKVLILFRA